MIPNVDYNSFLEFFTIVIQYFQLRRYQLQEHNDLSLELIMLIRMLLDLFSTYLNLLVIMMKLLRKTKRKRRLMKPHLLLAIMRGYRATLVRKDVWNNMSRNWVDFFWLTGETPQTLQELVDQLDAQFVHLFRNRRGYKLDFRNQVLLTFMWFRRYPTMHHLAMHFAIPVSCVHKILHNFIKILHAYLVPKYIKWHTMNKWRSLAGTYPEWPRVVGIVDCTPFRISKPKGAIQRIFYRKDRHCHFLNWLVIVDALGFVVLSYPGFLGRTSDTMCMSHINLPVLPQGLQIMADQGFEHNLPILVLPKTNQPQVSGIMKRTFRSRRSMIERCFGVLKNSYSAAGTRRFRSRRWNGPLICNVSAALYNRRKYLFESLRNYTGLHYMP